MSETQIQEIELDIEAAREFIERGEALDRLRENKDFKLIIMDGYFRDEAVRNVQLKSTYQFRDAESQELITKAIDGIGALHTFFQTVDFQASEAGQAIRASEEEIEDIENGFGE